MISKVLMLALVSVLAACGCKDSDAQGCGNCTNGIWTSTGNTSFCAGSCSSLNTAIIKIPDLKSGPSALPAYKDRVLLWTGEEWDFAERTSTDGDGEHWNILGTSNYGVSKKHPMWQSVPADPNDTPMCTGIVDGHPRAWKPKGGMCPIADATK